MAEMKQCRSCGAVVIWLKNGNTGKPAPINAAADPTGNILIVEDSYVIVHKGLREAYKNQLHTNHFATCPQAKTWHGGRKGTL